MLLKQVYVYAWVCKRLSARACVSACERERVRLRVFMTRTLTKPLLSASGEVSDTLSRATQFAADPLLRAPSLHH